MTLLSYGMAMTRLAEQEPDRVAIITDSGERITRIELEKQSNQLARAFLALGVKAEDFVTIGLPNSIEFFKCCLACWKIGAVPQPVSSHLPLKEQHSIISISQSTLLVGVAADCIDGVVAIAGDYCPSDLIDDSPLPDITAKHAKAMTSGGSTGTPKLIVDSTSGSVDIDVVPNRMKRNGCMLVPGPMYHTGPFVTAMQGLFSGATVVVMQKFDALRAIQLIHQSEIDWVLFVPTMMQRIWKLSADVKSSYPLNSLRIIMCTGAPTPSWLKQAWIDWLGAEKIFEAYGGSERIGATEISGTEWLSHKGSVGRPVNGTQVLIIDTAGNVLPHGEVGEVYLLPKTGTQSTFSYIGAAPKLHDGFQSLGDLGYLDKEGYLYLVDRLTDMIVSGGANIYPAEVEAAIDAFPNVRSSAVIGLPDEDLGQRVHAIVDVMSPVAENSLIEHLQSYLVRFKIPRSFEFVTEPLRDDGGKVRRYQLRETRIGLLKKALQ